MIKCVCEDGGADFERKVNELEAQGWKRVGNPCTAWSACGCKLWIIILMEKRGALDPPTQDANYYEFVRATRDVLCQPLPDDVKLATIKDIFACKDGEEVREIISLSPPITLNEEDVDAVFGSNSGINLVDPDDSDSEVGLLASPSGNDDEGLEAPGDDNWEDVGPLNPPGKSPTQNPDPPPSDSTNRPKERPYFQIREEGDDDPDDQVGD